MPCVNCDYEFPCRVCRAEAEPNATGTCRVCGYVEPLSLDHTCRGCVEPSYTVAYDLPGVPQHDIDGHFYTDWERSMMARAMGIQPAAAQRRGLLSNQAIARAKSEADLGTKPKEGPRELDDDLLAAIRARYDAIEMDPAPTRQQRATTTTETGLDAVTKTLVIRTVSVRCLRSIAKYENDAVEMTAEIQPGQDVTAVTSALRRLCLTALKTSGS